jgi:hypothetical protein
MRVDVGGARQDLVFPESRSASHHREIHVGFPYQLFCASIDLHQDTSVEVAVLIHNSGVSNNEVEIIPGANMIPGKVACSTGTRVIRKLCEGN